MKRVIRVRDAMSQKVLTVGPNTSAAQAAKKMSKHGVGSVVVAKSARPVGILTERDLLMKVVSRDLKASKVNVKKVMSSPVMTIDPDADVAEAARVMIRNRIRRLPVIEGKKLAGILTASDITAMAPELMEYLPERPEVPIGEEIEESVCEVCGEVTARLYEVNGRWVCENCRDFLAE